MRLCCVCATVFLVACSAPPRDLKRPNALALDAEGNLLVSDFHHERVLTFAPDGSLRSSFGRRGLGRGELWQVWSLAVEADGAVLVANQRITSPRDETESWEIKRFRGDEEVAVHVPDEAIGWIDGLGADPTGGYLVADSDVGVLLRFDADGRSLGPFAVPDDRASWSPSFARFLGDDWWLLDQYAHHVRRVDPKGEVELAFTREGDGRGELRFPRAIGVCPGRWFVVADLANHRVQRFDADGRFLDGFSPERSAPSAPVQLMDVVVSADCKRLYLADSKGNRVLVTSPRGEVEGIIDRW